MPDHCQPPNSECANPLARKIGTIINVGDGDVVPLVEVGTRPVGIQGIGVHKAKIVVVGGVIDGVAIGVESGIQFQTTRCCGAEKLRNAL